MAMMMKRLKDDVLLDGYSEYGAGVCSSEYLKMVIQP